MKKILILACGALLFATSCLDGGNSYDTSSATYNGKVTVTDIDTGDVSYSDDKASITVIIPNIIEPKFDIVFNNIKFDVMMPQLSIKLAGVPFTSTVSEDESSINYIFEAQNIVPTIGDIKYEKYKVTTIEGCIGKIVDVIFEIESKEKRVHFTTAKESVETTEN